ncbi:hypothetical protein DL98DRAFT_264074 [Cadophora sp. DSE1049]|nr:hypothetical protein DL98DRAFT_264074 [Cadophora sp. DSE1049]
MTRSVWVWSHGVFILTLNSLWGSEAGESVLRPATPSGTRQPHPTTALLAVEKADCFTFRTLRTRQCSIYRAVVRPNTMGEVGPSTSCD